MKSPNVSKSTARVQSALAALNAKLEQLSPECRDLLATELDRLSARLDEFAMQAPAGSDQPGPGMPEPAQQPDQEQSLESEARARVALAKDKAIFDAFPLGITISDDKGQVIESNAEAERLLGLQTAAHAKRKIDSPEWQIVRPDGTPMPPEEFASTRALKEKRLVENVEMGILRPDGDVTWINVSATPIPLEGYGVVITYSDITPRRQAENYLKAALAEAAEAAEEAATAASFAAIAANEAASEKARLLAVMEALPVGLAIVDSQGANIQANQAFEKMWGGPRPLTTSINDYASYKAWWPDSGQLVQPEEWASAQVLRRGEAVVGQLVQIERFDGSRIYVLNSAAPIFDAQGQITGSAVVIQDISDRIQAEQALALANSRFNTLLDNLPVAVALTDSTGDFLISNPANQALFGGSGITGDASGPSGGYTLRHTDGSLFPATELPLVRSLKKGEIVQNVEIIIRHENGEETPILANSSPIRGPDGSIQGAVAAMQDVTSLKQVEMQQRLLEFREKERQEIARDLHDGPIQDLSGILFNIQFAKETIQNQAVKLEFEQIGLGVQGVIRGLRDVCNNLRPPSLIRFGLSRAILVHTEELCERNPGLEIQRDLFQDADPAPEQTSLALYRIYQEAMNNILRHANASRIHILLAVEEGQILLQISDNGAGFTVPTDLAGQTRTGHFGLAGMQERAEIINANLQITSIPGQGTVVRVTVPKGSRS